MLHDYKGETPRNVITEEEHKKRPFYKKVSFWVLSTLGLFFGGCSVYGLVLGYQYVQAVTQAAHIIADANDSGDSLSKNKNHLVTPSGYDDVFEFTFVLYQPSEGSHLFRLTDGVEVSNPSFDPAFLVTYSPNTDASFYLYWRGKQLSIPDFVYNIETINCEYLPNASSGYGLVRHGASSGWPMTVSGSFAFDPYAYGYDQGYSVGSDAINLPQSVKVLLPEGNQYSVQYKSYLDGVADREGQLASSQTGGAYTSFDRSRNQKLKIDLTIPSGSRAFFTYSPFWTSSYPTDENYSLRQSWAVSGVTYLPTWVTNPQIYVGFTSADVPDLTYQTISVAFDVDHWGDIKVGAYAEGYTDGYQDGEQNPTAYDSGYQAGYDQGYDDGHLVGINQGEAQAVGGQKALVNMFVTAFQQPFDQIYRFLNFNVLGLNILALFTSLLTLSIGIIIIKKVI